MRSTLPALLLAGCASVPAAAPPTQAPVVAASAETDPVDTAHDAADDPAIWPNAKDPAQSFETINATERARWEKQLEGVINDWVKTTPNGAAVLKAFKEEVQKVK